MAFAVHPFLPNYSCGSRYCIILCTPRLRFRATSNSSMSLHPHISMSTNRRRRMPLSANLGLAVGLALSVSFGRVASAVPILKPETIMSEKVLAVGASSTPPNFQSAKLISFSTNLASETDNGSTSKGTVEQVVTNSSTTAATNSSRLPDGVTVEDTEGHQSLGERLADNLRKKGLPDELVVFLLSAMPVVELRAGVPIGFVLGLHPARIFVLSVLGNMAPIIPVIFLLRIKAVQTLAARFLERARRKASSMGTSDSRAVALALFVGIPLPGTGAWTGSVVAFVLGMPIGQTLISLLAGVLMAACIMTVLCALGKVGAALAGAVLLGVGVSSMLRVDAQLAPRLEEHERKSLADGSPEAS